MTVPPMRVVGRFFGIPVVASDAEKKESVRLIDLRGFRGVSVEPLNIAPTNDRPKPGGPPGGAS